MERALVQKETALIISEKSRVGIERAKQDSIQIWGWLNLPHFSKGTKENYERITRQFFSFHWNVGLKEITTPHITLFLKQLEGKSDSTLNLARSSLSSLFRHLEVTGYIARNPVVAIKSKKIHPDIQGKIIPQDSIIRMIEFAGSKRNALLLKVLYFGAFRESEVIQLKPESFSPMQDGRVKASIIGKGKKPRVVHLPENLWQEIKSFVKESHLASDEFIFSSEEERKNPISRQQVFRIIKSIARIAKVEPVPSPHWFRHTSSEHAFKNGASLKEIQETLGHSSLSTTQFYLGGRADKSNSDYLNLPLGKS